MILVRKNNVQRLLKCFPLLLILLSFQLSLHNAKCDSSVNDNLKINNNLINNNNVSLSNDNNKIDTKSSIRRDVNIKINRFIDDLKSGNSSRIIKSLTDLLRTVGLPNAQPKNNDTEYQETREFKNASIANEVRFYKSPFKKTIYYAKSLAKKAVVAYHAYSSELALGQCLFKYVSYQYPDIARQFTIKTVFGIVFKIYNTFMRFMLQNDPMDNAIMHQDEIGGKVADMTSDDYKNYFYKNKNVGDSAVGTSGTALDGGYTYNTGNGIQDFGTGNGYTYSKQNSQIRRVDYAGAKNHLLSLRRRIDSINELQFLKRRLMLTSRNNANVVPRKNSRQARQYDYQSPIGPSSTSGINFNLDTNSVDNSYPPAIASDADSGSLHTGPAEQPTPEFMASNLFNIDLFGKNGWALVDFQNVIYEHFGLAKAQPKYPLFKCAQVYGFSLFWKKIEELFLPF